MRGIIRNTVLMLFALLFSACLQKNQEEGKENEDVRMLVGKWQERKVIIPNDLVFTQYAADTVDYQYLQNPYKVFVYVDSIGCLSCKLQLPRWKQIINELDSITSHNISFLFIFDTRRLESVKDVLVDKSFDYPIYIDIEGRLNKLNKFSPDSRFQTFLLGEDNKVEVIGNPVRNLSVLDLYTKFLRGEAAKVSNEERTIVNISQQDADLGILSKGEIKTINFTITNVGRVPLVIKGVTTSCDCTSAKIDCKKVATQASVKLIVQYKADTEGEFLRTVSLFCNVDRSPIEFMLTGKVE